MVKARKYVVKKHFQGLPKREDFEIVEYELPSLGNGDILIKTEWVSVDPYLRGYNSRYPVPYDQFGYQVGIVEESKEPKFPVGTRVVTHNGWCDYVVANANLGSDLLKPGPSVSAIPDLKGLPNSLAIGAVGMPGATAYFGLLELCKPKAGETLVVTGAAGAVGSLVGQIGKIKGCKVIGFAGSDDKVKWLEEIGFDKAFNYKTVDATAALKEAAPKGVDCFFDNVGGVLSGIIINQMNDYGRVAVCGCISTYNDDPTQKPPTAPILQPAMVFKQLKIEGFIANRWLDRWHEAFADIVKWIVNGELTPREHVVEGFDKLFDAFLGMLNGENVGKAVVKI